MNFMPARMLLFATCNFVHLVFAWTNREFIAMIVENYYTATSR